MRLASALVDGRPTYGALVDDGFVDLGAQLGEQAPTLRHLLETGGLDRVADVIEGSTSTLDPEQLEWLPVVPNARQIFCVGLNYRKHVVETGRELPKYPTMFLRLPTSQVGHRANLVRPRVSTEYDYEGELAVVIGVGGRHIAATDAFDHVAGYSCYNDGSVRDWQYQTSQFTAGKNFEASGGFGPYLVTRDEIPDVESLQLTTFVNGEQRQQATIDDLIFPIEELIAHISTFAPLLPGDVIVTGTPDGVGAHRKPPQFLEAGDVVQVEISGIGTLEHAVIDER